MTKLKDCDKAWINVNLATMCPDQMDPYGLLFKYALGVKDGHIACMEPMSQVTATRLPFEVIDAHLGWMTPGLIDCHTHLVYAGHRALEFEQRLKGASFDSIARHGGGIMSTVRATKVRSIEQLLKASSPRLMSLCNEGATMVEIKSGYGLSLADEIKILTVARKLETYNSAKITTTLLAAHVLPPEFAGRPDDYIEMVCSELIPEVALLKLADAVDVYCESVAFDIHQCMKVLKAAKQNNLPIKGHMEQRSYSGSASLASRMGAISCDHLEYIDEAGVADMAQAGTVAVLLPGSFYALQELQKPPIDLFRQYSVPMAIATDINPAISPLSSIRLMMNMACVLFRLTPAEALAGATREAAKALGKQNQMGIISEGRHANLCLWDINHPAELAYQIGPNPLKQRIIDGLIITDY